MIDGIEGRDVRCPSGAANAATDGETLGGRPDALESENAVVKTTVPFHRTPSERALIVGLIAEIERRNDDFSKEQITNSGRLCHANWMRRASRILVAARSRAAELSQG